MHKLCITLTLSFEPVFRYRYAVRIFGESNETKECHIQQLNIVSMSKTLFIDILECLYEIRQLCFI